MNNEVFRIIGWNIMNLRQESQLTQIQLGEKTGLSNHQISRIEQGRGDTTLENLNVLSLFFDIPLEELFKKRNRADIEFRIRSHHLEKSAKSLPSINYTKEIPSSAKIRLFELPFKTFRRVQLEPKYIYDFCVIEGTVMFNTHETADLLTKPQILSLKGKGTVRISNSQHHSAKILVMAY